ncbi:MAG: putative rane-bound dehydrogenase [Planctomycetota bacterium]|nr:putative rane-bound dehydrogenase [Planctomycetota bacterium]
MTRPNRWCPFAAMAVLIFAVPHETGAQGLSAAQARDRMVVPDGFRVEVFASEPEIRQPVAACFDERGRMWVIEYLQYPTPAGLVPVKVDQYLRTEYDRFPEPPPRGPKGADRIKILEDTDGDGKADKVTTFLEGLNLASAIAVGDGGVYIGQAPYLLFYPDKDHDDKPDGDPEVLLSGFGLQDAHATVNSLAWGPDGWLYGAQGSTVTAKIRGVEFQQGIWRYHPRTRQFELFAEGGGNTWGLDFDRGGNAFGSSNGSYIAFHMVQGGNYVKGFAKHGPLHNPRSYGYFDPLSFTGTKPGGHVTPGGIIYKGEAYPPEFRGSFIGANLLSNSVYWYKLAPKGSTYAMTLGGTLLNSRDPWFRAIDLLTGPDGSVFVVDWYDKRASHLDPRDTWDRTNGRIYKIVYKDTKPAAPFDLAKLSTDELIALRLKANDWWSETARRVLYERNDPTAVPKLKSLLAEDKDEPTALRDLFALNACGGIDEATVSGLLEHPIAGVRRWAVRLIGDRGEPSTENRTRLELLAQHEKDVTVRSQLASSSGRFSPRTSLRLLEKLAMHDEDVNDPYVPLLIWWSTERAMRTDPEAAVSGLGSLATSLFSGRDLSNRHLLPRIARALADDGSPEALRQAARLIDMAKLPDQRDIVIAAMEKGLEGRRPNEVPASLEAILDQLWAAPHPSLALIRFSIRLGVGPGYQKALDLLDAKDSSLDRLALIEVLGQVPKPEGKAALLRLLDRNAPDPVVQAMLSALGSYPESEVADAIIRHYPKWSVALRARALDALCGRKAWAGILLDAMARGTFTAKDLSASQATRIASLGDPALTAKLTAAWGRVPGPNGPAKVKRIAEVRGILPEGDKGDPSRGREVFVKNCAGCHRLFGEGERIGPELTGSERGNLDYLLTSLVDPSAEIRKEYQAQTFALKDGRVLSGLIVEETGSSLVLFDSQKQKTTIPKADIEQRKAADVSLMPEGLVDTLPEAQIRDLFRYLQSAGK